MRRRLRRGFLSIFPITCLIACILTLWVSRDFVLDDSRLRYQEVQTFNSGWQVSDGQRTTAMSAVPRALTVNRGSLTLQNTLPDNLFRNGALCFFTSNEAVRVTVDGREIYSYGRHDETAFGSYFGNVWIMVPLDESCAGKTISVELTALSDQYAAGSYSFYLDNRNTLILNLLSKNTVLFASSLIGMSNAMTMILVGVLIRRKGRISRARIYLGMFVLLGHLWALSYVGTLQFLLSNKAISYTLNYSAMMLLPVPFALYLAEMFPGQNKKPYHIAAALFCLYYLIRVALYVANLIALGDYSIITHGLMLLGSGYAVFLSFSACRQGGSRIALGGILVFLGVAFVGVLIFYVNPQLRVWKIDYALLLSFSFNLLLIFFYMVLLKNNVAMVNQSLQLEHQAYTDAMTQVSNRAAFNLEVERLDANTYPRLTLFMVDLNNLKQVNDTLGHPTGDKLICALANCLEDAFRDLGTIYRYGGDEFVVIIEDAPIDAVNTARALFDLSILQRSQRGGCDISVAVGMASRLEDQNSNLHVLELLHLADVAMYRIKTLQKTPPTSIQSIRHYWLEQVDAATGILTFAAFKTRVYDALASAEVDFPCIINFDLNNFDGYNNLFGWDAGNQLLQKLTAMAMRLCGKKGFCAHSDADSFWVFADMPDLDTLTRRITEETRHFQAQLGDCLLFPSFGIYCINEYMSPVSDMCSRATSVKKEIKGHFDVLYAVYSPEAHQRRIENMKLTSYMQKGLDSDEFVAFFQPKFSLDGRQLLGAEALVRWAQTPGKPTSPAEFTDLFEKSGLILALDWYMLEKTCIFLRRQLDSNRRCVPVSVNFSRLHVYEENSVERICKMVNRYRLPHNLIEFELTETAFVQSTGRMTDLISALRSEGFCVALDDFGSGLSSLGLLKHLAVDVIKIDQSLVRSCVDSNVGSSILESVLRLCRRLNIKTVAEGVETQAHFDALQHCDCDMLQGMFLASSMPEAEFEAMLIAHQDELAKCNA